jgi:hypothetical protein
VDDDALAAELFEEEKRARKEMEAREFAQLQVPCIICINQPCPVIMNQFLTVIFQEQYGISDGNSYRSQANRALERAVFSGELTVTDVYSQKEDLMVEASSGVDNGHSCTKGGIFDPRRSC